MRNLEIDGIREQGDRWLVTGPSPTKQLVSVTAEWLICPRSAHGQARPVQKFVEAAGDGLSVWAALIVVKEDHGGILGPRFGGG